MPPAEQQETAKQTTPNAQTKMAIRPCRTTRDREASNVQGAEPNGDMPLPNNKSREANNIQCANQNGDTPLPSNNSSQEQQHPMRRVEWRYAPAGQQQTAKQTTSNAQTKMAFRHCRVTTVREASNVQCADQNGVPPQPSNNRLQTKMLFRPTRTTRDFIPRPAVFPLNFFLKSRILYL